MAGGWGEVPGGVGQGSALEGETAARPRSLGREKQEEGGRFVAWSPAGCKWFFIFTEGVFRIQGSQHVDGGEGSIGSVPKALHAPSGLLKHPWGPGRWQHLCSQVRNPGPARLSDLAQGRQFTVCV